MRGLVLVVGTVLVPARAGAGVEAWRVAEVMTAGNDGDPAVRYVELATEAEACWFPSTRVDLFDAGGALLGSVAPFAEAICVPAGRRLLLATDAAAAVFAVTADSRVVPALPRAAGQLCVISSTTAYDCVRWGAITTPVLDVFAPEDGTAAIAAPPGLVLARIADTDVVAADWRIETPTPGRANDGSPWEPPDAGPDGGSEAVDAAVEDASIADARPDAAHFDAGPSPDARGDRFLDLEAAGGAGCGCRAGGQGGGAALASVLVMAAMGIRRRRR